MKKHITYMQDNGVIAIIVPAYNDRVRPVSESENDLLARVIAKAVPSGVPYKVINASAGPKDRVFRDAWVQDSAGKPIVDMPKARIIHMDRIRLVRDVVLTELDIVSIMALESRDIIQQDEIAARKQVLRDIPQTFDLSTFTTPSTLNSAWPVEFPRIPI